VVVILAVLSKRGGWSHIRRQQKSVGLFQYILPDVVAYHFSLESIYGAGTRYVHMAEQLVYVYIFLASGVVCTIKNTSLRGGGEEGRGWVLQPFCFYHSHFYERERGKQITEVQELDGIKFETALLDSGPYVMVYGISFYYVVLLGP
jgi:hypothetical protein